jgi:hypothetical protein
MNILAIVISVAFSMALGFWWYSAAGFGKQWMAAMKVTPAMIAKYKKEGKGMGKQMAILTLATLLSAIALAHLVDRMGVITWIHGALFGLFISVAFVVLTTVSATLFERRPQALFWISGGYYVVSYVVMGAILGAFS